VKDHQTVEPNAKYTCTAKRFYVTDILKSNRTRATVSIESKWTEPNMDKTPIEPNRTGTLTLTEPKPNFC